MADWPRMWHVWQMRRTVTLLAIAGLLAVPATAGSKSAALPFKLGTYSGTVGGDAKFKFKFYRGTCEKKRQYAVPTKGVCFKAVGSPVLSAACDDGSTQTKDLYTYDTHISNSGRYSDHLITSDTQNTVAEYT